MKIVTSALPYVNNIPHLGNLVTVLSADAYQKYLKLAGEEHISILGTDAHGTTTETVALQEGISCEEIVKKYDKKHKEIYDWFQCNFDCYGMTSDAENHEITKSIFKKAHENGYIQEKEIEQFFDKKAQKFLADRFIEGECPHCNAKDARGDQCDTCQKLLEPKDLINPKSKLTNTKPTVKKTKHLYLALDKLQNQLEKIDTNKWDSTAKGITKGWLNEGLKPRAITRDLQWGINVPLKGYENKVFYVWFDAPIGYISITKKHQPNWKDLWRSPNELIQFMGKDNVPFHTIMFPAALIATKQDWPIVKQVSTNHYLNFEGKKFSKSKQIGIFGDDAIKSGITSDAWRYYLLSNRPQSADTNFTLDDFQAKINQNLIGNFVNLVSRVTNIIANNEMTLVSNPKGFSNKELDEIRKDYQDANLREAVEKIMSLSAKANTYMQENEPWKLVTENKEKAKIVLSNLILQIVQISNYIEPITPTLSSTILKKLNITKGINKDTDYSTISITKKIAPMQKITDEQIEKLKPKKESQKQTPKRKSIALRVGKITSVKEHPQADSLYIENITFGQKDITIVSGLKKYYEPTELEGKKVIIVENLKPAKLRGEKSEGMLLAVANKDTVNVLDAQNYEIGEYIIGSSESSQIKIDEFFQNELKIKDEELLLNGKKISTKSLKTKNNLNGIVK